MSDVVNIVIVLVGIIHDLHSVLGVQSDLLRTGKVICMLADSVPYHKKHKKMLPGLMSPANNNKPRLGMYV